MKDLKCKCGTWLDDRHQVKRIYGDQTYIKITCGYCKRSVSGHTEEETEAAWARLQSQAELSEPVYKAVERILDDYSAWIARPSDEVTKAIALQCMFAVSGIMVNLEAYTSRDVRQSRVADWCAAAFGTGQASSVEQRGLRLLEEAIEAYQAAGCNREQAHKLVDYVFSRPAGDLRQELGGVGITLLALANASGASADAEEVRELDRVLSKPLEHFAARNQAKNDAGFAAQNTVDLPCDVEPTITEVGHG